MTDNPIPKGAYCEGCQHNGFPARPATHRYEWKDGSGETALCCKTHHDEWTTSERILVMAEAALAEKQDRYPDAAGSKGGGASHDMARKLDGVTGEMRIRILRYIASHGPCGAEQAAEGALLHPDTGSPRCSELVTLGLLEKGERTATTARGNPAHVYRITDVGRRAIAQSGQGVAA